MSVSLNDLRAMHVVADAALEAVGDGDWTPQDSALRQVNDALRYAIRLLDRAPHGWVCAQMPDPLDIECESDEECTCWKEDL